MKVHVQSSGRAFNLAAMSAWSTSFHPQLNLSEEAPSNLQVQMTRSSRVLPTVIRYNDVASEATEVGIISGANSVSHGSSAGIRIHRPTLILVLTNPVLNSTGSSAVIHHLAPRTRPSLFHRLLT